MPKAICIAFLTGLSTMLFAQPAFVFSPTSIPNGQYGAAYPRQKITVTGGSPPYTFSISKGSLPTGMSLSANGVLSGTPGAAGTYTFTVTAKEKSGGRHEQGPDSGDQDYTLVIDPASLTVTANNASINYGSPLPTLSFSITGFVNGDNASSLNTPPTITTTATASSPPGTYPIAASGATDPNYTINYIPGTLTIHGAVILASANPATKQYGTADPPLTYIVSGLPNGVNLTGSLSRSPGENVGSYPITIGSLTAGGNYTISFTGNNFTITKAAQQITWIQTLSIGCSASSIIQLDATASSGLSVTYTISDKSIATISGDILTLLKPGTAVVTALQSGNGNYTAAEAVSDTVLYQSTSLISQHWNDVLFFDNSSGDYIAWQWYKNDSAIAGATDPYYSETPLDGQYFVIATNKDRQQIQTCILTITPGTAIPAGVRVFPNPAARGTSVTVVSNYSADALQGAILQITDMKGLGLRRIANVQPSTQVTMPSEAGIYVIDLLLAGGQKTSVNVLVRN
ncbi:MAG TPA: MBG domain-containing protein [Puia sp.]|jgi:hypothetical protein|nr:MBG domain-containing protein [Puia sp.]